MSTARPPPPAALSDFLATLVETAGAAREWLAALGPGSRVDRAEAAEIVAACRVARAVLAEVQAAASGEVVASTPPASSMGPLIVASDGSWCFVVGSSRRIDLASRRTLRRLVTALATARTGSPGRPVASEELIAVGWPGERIASHAAHNRLYFAICTLRRLGLRDVLLTVDGGYCFDPHVALVFEEGGRAASA